MAWSNNWNDVYPQGEFHEYGPAGSYCAPTSGWWGKTRSGNRRVIDREDKSTGALCASFKSMNYRNGNGSAPAEIQRRLNRYMADMRRRGVAGVPASLTVDGILGAASDRAITWYQARMGLTADGLVGSSTWAFLRTA